MFNIAAPSRMRALTVGMSATFSDESLEGTDLSKQLTISDFVPSRNLPIFESDGGHAWFSCEKNSSRSPSRVWQDMYSLEKSEQSFLRDDN